MSSFFKNPWLQKINECLLEGAKPDRGGNSCCGASSSGSGPTVMPKSLAVNSHSHGQTSVSATQKTTVTITTATNGGTASTTNSATAAAAAEEGTTNVMVNQMPPDERSVPPGVKTCVESTPRQNIVLYSMKPHRHFPSFRLEQAETQPVIKSAMTNSPSCSSAQLQNKPYVTKRISFHDGDGRPSSSSLKTATSFAKAAPTPTPPPPQPSIKVKETLSAGKVASPQEGRCGAAKEGEVDDEEDYDDDEEEEEGEESRWIYNLRFVHVSQIEHGRRFDESTIPLTFCASKPTPRHAYVMKT